MKPKIVSVFLAVILFLLPAFASCVADTGSNSDSPQSTNVPEDAYSSLIRLLENEVNQLRTEQSVSEAEYNAKLAELERKLSEASEASKPADDENLPFIYNIEDDKAIITAYDGNYSVLVIPATLGGKPVTEIADSVFAGNTKLTSVSLPQGMKKVGWFAFSGCTELKSINIPNTVSDIGYDAFAYCTKLTIYCLSGSYTEEFAASYGLGCVVS